MVGVPVRIEAGPKDMQNNQAVLVRRDTGEKLFVARSEIATKVKELLVLMVREPRQGRNPGSS